MCEDSNLHKGCFICLIVTSCGKTLRYGYILLILHDMVSEEIFDKQPGDNPWCSQTNASGVYCNITHCCTSHDKTRSLHAKCSSNPTISEKIHMEGTPRWKFENLSKQSYSMHVPCSHRPDIRSLCLTSACIFWFYCRRNQLNQSTRVSNLAATQTNLT